MKNGKYRNKKRPGIGFVVGICLVMAITLFFAGYYFWLRTAVMNELSYDSYRYHIAIISDETDNSFWEEVYAGAKEAGEDYDAYVEQIDDDLGTPFSIEDAINASIYAGVDGILLRPTEGQVSQEIIDKAYDYGIPVVTMQKDLTNVKRQGFVGINDYFLGQEYGKQVLKLAQADTHLVTVLVPGATFDLTSQSWFQQGLSSTVEGKDIAIDLQIIHDDNGLNNAEDVIHAIAKGQTKQPDIIICLDETITLSTSQLVSQSGLAGQVQVIGSYVSDAILAEIIQGNLDSTITIDPQELGGTSVDALMTYLQYHMVSYYTEVDTMLIDRDVALTYGEEADQDG